MVPGLNSALIDKYLGVIQQLRSISGLNQWELRCTGSSRSLSVFSGRLGKPYDLDTRRMISISVQSDMTRLRISMGPILIENPSYREDAEENLTELIMDGFKKMRKAMQPMLRYLDLGTRKYKPPQAVLEPIKWSNDLRGYLDHQEGLLTVQEVSMSPAEICVSLKVTPNLWVRVERIAEHAWRGPYGGCGTIYQAVRARLDESITAASTQVNTLLREIKEAEEYKRALVRAELPREEADARSTS